MSFRADQKILIPFLVFFLGIAVLSRWEAESGMKGKFPSLDKLILSEFFVNDLGFILFGSRRAAADLGYIQYLQYYSTPPAKSMGEGPSFNLARSPLSFKVFAKPFLDEKVSGPYPRLYEIFLRILRLDPFFNSAVMEGGCVLAFNHNRVKQALSLLKEGLDWDPFFHRYRLYMTAILYQYQGKEEKLVDLLYQVIRYPDCPVLLERTLGNLLLKYSRTEEAADVFNHIVATAPQISDRVDAQNRLTEILIKHPILKSKFPSSIVIPVPLHNI